MTTRSPNLEAIFALQLRATGMPPHVTEYAFHPTRKWRFDAAWPDLKVAVEIDGGTGNGGRHVRPVGFRNDCIKLNEAALLGWLVLRGFSPSLNRRAGRFNDGEKWQPAGDGRAGDRREMMEETTYTITTTRLYFYERWLKYQYIFDVCAVVYFLLLVAWYAVRNEQWWGLLAYAFAAMGICNISLYKDDYNWARLIRMIEQEHRRRFVK